ncbi:glycosyltransferase family 2 protein [Candidatus Falkowbacteria bacterium]|nr:glycosyltransferase family 2 protein [Candidatus Falkowbacteria bacterium]
MLDIFLISYNKAQWLEEGIRSALAQGEGVRVSVIDNNSSDNSVEICKRYPVRLYALKENLGMIGALNFAVDQCQEEYLLAISAEDPLTPGVIPKMMALFRDGETEVVGCDYFDITAAGQKIRKFRCSFGPELLLYCSMSGHAVFKRRVFDRVRWREEKIDGVSVYADWSFWMRCLDEGIKARVLHEIGFRYRVHGNSHSGNANQVRNEFKKKIRNEFAASQPEFVLKFLRLLWRHKMSLYNIAYTALQKIKYDLFISR